MAWKNHARDSFAILRTVQVSELRGQLAQPPLALIVGADARRAQEFAFALAGDATPDEQAARATMSVATPDLLDGLRFGPVPYDALILLDPSDAVRRHPVVRQIAAQQAQTAVLELRTDPAAPLDPGVPALVVPDLTDPVALRTVRKRLVPLLHPDRRLAWGRAFAGFRQPITDHLIEQTARANAQFALMADLGARIPIVGAFAATGADFFVLTKNQLNLAYQLAAIHGRDLNDQKTVLMNAAPHLLAGLGWRELAGRAIRFVPGASFVPKAAIAYGGTVASGMIARTLANPDGVRAWLRGVQAGTTTSLGVTNRGLHHVADGVKARITGATGAIEDRFGARTHLRPKWRRDRALPTPLPAD